MKKLRDGDGDRAVNTFIADTEALVIQVVVIEPYKQRPPRRVEAVELPDGTRGARATGDFVRTDHNKDPVQIGPRSWFLPAGETYKVIVRGHYYEGACVIPASGKTYVVDSEGAWWF